MFIKTFSIFYLLLLTSSIIDLTLYKKSLQGLMNKNNYIMEDISKRNEVRALIKSSGKIKVHLCEIAIYMNSSLDFEFTIDKSPSPKFTKKMDVGILFFDYNMPLIDELMRR